MPSPNTVYVMESANLFVGGLGNAAQPGISTHLTILELKLPGIEENLSDHYPGGAQVGIEVPMYVTRLEATFNLAGWQPAVMRIIGSNKPENRQFTAYGLVRDRRTSSALRAMAKIEGHLGRMNPTAFSKGAGMHHEFSIRSIVHYELYMQTNANADSALSRIFFWDFFTSQRIIGSGADSEDLNADLNNILGLNNI